MGDQNSYVIVDMLLLEAIGMALYREPIENRLASAGDIMVARGPRYAVGLSKNWWVINTPELLVCPITA